MSKSLRKQNGYVFYHTRSSDSTKFSMNFVTHLFFLFLPFDFIMGLNFIMDVYLQQIQNILNYVNKDRHGT